jgi:hypothetical protein
MKRFIYALTGLVFTASVAWGANIPLITGPQDPSQLNATINQLIQSINSGITPQSLAAFGSPRNLLDNGAMAVQQRGTGTVTCGTTTIPSSAYAADRWGCNVNVTSGAGTLQVITTAANLPASPAFTAGHVFYRTSGTLAQSQCVMQEIPTSRVTPLQGTSVTLSVYMQGLALMLAEQTTVNAYLFTGTGTDQGLQSFTASPAVTPAFTGIASTQTAAFTITSSWARYNATFQVGATVTEAAVALCWTPTTGGTAGATDGFRFTGVQLEQGLTASPYEFQPYGNEFATALRFFYKITESATAATTRGSCTNLTSSISNCVVTFPVPMFKVPTMTYATGFGIAVAAQTSYTACTANATSTTATSVASTLAVLMSCATSAAGGALGTSTTWGDSGGTGTISASADF